ncbi:MAG: CBS domain-containing protein [Deltaproteobacteria bacterium]|nr:MAG: CBS domain-containing protein [Deltaproteobacteria bacterium]
MLVKYWMAADLISVDEDISLIKASRLMKENRIKHLPVLKRGRLVGIVSDRDLKEAQPSNASTLDVHELHYLLDQVKMKDIMSADPYTTSGEEIVERAASVMLEHDISALPVVDQKGDLEGIITKGDLFRAMIAISGIAQAQLQVGLEVKDQPGSIKEATDLIRIHGGRIVSITTHYNGAPEGSLHIYIRCKEVENEEVLFDQLSSRYKVLYRTHYKVD